MRKNAAVIGVAAAACLALAAGPASAGPEQANEAAKRVLTPELTQLNGSGGSGSGTVTVTGNKVTLNYTVSGVLADAPHAQHIHFGEEARHECPVASDDVNDDGRINTAEGLPAYGPIATSLTLFGDTSPASALAVDRFPTAPGGTFDYSRTIKVDRSLAKAIQAGEAVIVVHGLDYNGNGEYDFEGAGVSELTPGEPGAEGVLPAEATDPAVCGVID